LGIGLESLVISPIKNVTIEEKPWVFRMNRVHYLLYMPIQFFPQCQPTSIKDMLPFYKSKIFILSLKLSTLCTLLGRTNINFTLLFGLFGFLGDIFSHKCGQGKHSVDHPMT
jgi:hypothetical protein